MTEDISKSISRLQKESYQQGYKHGEQDRIAEFLKRLDWIMERVEFHTENPDSELIDELIHEHEEWEKRII